MPELRVSPDEQARVEAVCRELESAMDDFFADARDLLTDEQWGFLSSYVTACIARALEIGGLLHAVVDAQGPRAVEYRGRGREVFVREGLAAWRDAFAPVPQIWKLVPILSIIPGGEERVLADIATLEVMAANRMFRSLDEQCAAWVGEG